MNAYWLLNVLPLLPVLLVGLLLPRLSRSRRGVVFGVTVPLEFAESPAAETSLRRYRNQASAVAAVVALLCLCAVALQQRVTLIEMVPYALVLQMVAASFLWQRERRRFLPHAIVVPLERSAELTPNRNAGALLGTAASVLPIVATAVWLHFHWAQIPARWPRHWNTLGVADGFGVRSVSSVYLPCLVGVMSVLLFTAMVAFLRRASGTGTTQRTQALPPMVVLAWLIAEATCWTALIPVLPPMNPTAMAAVALSYTAVLVLVIAWMMYRMSGRRALQASEPYDGTPDAHWYGGIFYYNPGDAAVLVPKRYGWGWTFNFARPAAWAFTVVILGFVAVSVWLPKILR